MWTVLAALALGQEQDRVPNQDFAVAYFGAQGALAALNDTHHNGRYPLGGLNLGFQYPLGFRSGYSNPAIALYEVGGMVGPTPPGFRDLVGVTPPFLGMGYLRLGFLVDPVQQGGPYFGMSMATVGITKVVENFKPRGFLEVRAGWRVIPADTYGAVVEVGFLLQPEPVVPYAYGFPVLMMVNLGGAFHDIGL